MPKRIPNHTIRIQRNGETVQPKIGAPFEFTDAEIKTLLALNPESLSKVIAKDDNSEGVETISLTQADLDQRIAEAKNSDRPALEAEIRAQILAEQQAAAAGDAKPEVTPEPDVKTVKDTGGKAANSKAATQAKDNASADDDI